MKEYYGKIDVEVAKKVLSDHYDVYLKKEDNPCSHTVEGHYELDPFEYWGARLPYRPAGAVDGKVMDSDMAKGLSPGEGNFQARRSYLLAKHLNRLYLSRFPPFKNFGKFQVLTRLVEDEAS